MPNRLANETSPYLLQHQDNPVDWYPWGDEAFARAALENKPVFLSIGYSSCHWCHVMAHESFEDVDVATYLNKEFISVKVDREERPDLDEAFMAAVQLTSGRGGWPMSVFLTPSRLPFFAGTYFPKTDRGSHPGFGTVCRQIAGAWKTREEDLLAAARQISEAVHQAIGRTAPEATLAFDQSFLDKSVTAILEDFDSQNGGFGPAPKFPPHTSIEFLLSYATQTDGPPELCEAAASAALITLQKMVLGGIHDHVGGGFHRYSTDDHWLLPHFEKMLYDNALMLGNLARASSIAEAFAPDVGDRFRRVAAGIVDWATREMMSSDYLFYSAIDADSEGEEGKFYVWTEAEIGQVLGDRAAPFMSAYGFSGEGNFAEEATGKKSGANIPHLQEDAGPVFEEDLEALLAARQTRVHPARDEKAIVAWNGMMVSAVADVGLVPLAAATAEAILSAEQRHGDLPRQIVQGEPRGAAFLDDYAFFADSLFRLAAIAEAFESEGESVKLPRPYIQYRYEAERLGREMIAKFYDPEVGAFFFTSNRHEVLFGRSKPILDQPTPSANAGALRVLTEMGEVELSQKSLQIMLGWLDRAPHATEAFLEAALPLLQATTETETDVRLPTVVEPQISPVPVAPKDVRITLSRSEIIAGADGYGQSEIIVQVPEGLHLNSNDPPARWLTPTRLTIKPVKSEISYPPAVNDRFSGEFAIPFRILLPPGQAAAEFEISVSYQACTESECQLAKEKVFGAVILRA